MLGARAFEADLERLLQNPTPDKLQTQVKVRTAVCKTPQQEQNGQQTWSLDFHIALELEIDQFQLQEDLRYKAAQDTWASIGRLLPQDTSQAMQGSPTTSNDCSSQGSPSSTGSDCSQVHSPDQQYTEWYNSAEE